MQAVRPTTAAVGGAGVLPQTQDKNYFLILMQNRVAEIEEEIESLRAEVEEFDRESEKFVGYEQKAERLTEDVAGLQATLTEYNMLVDKANTDTSLEDIIAQV